MFSKVFNILSIPKNWKILCDFLKFKKEFGNWTISAFDYDPSVWFIVEFDVQLRGWGSYSEEKHEGYTLHKYERTVSSLVLFRTKIFRLSKKWIEIIY